MCFAVLYRTFGTAKAAEKLPLATQYAALVAAIRQNASGLIANNTLFLTQLDGFEKVRLLT